MDNIINLDKARTNIDRWENPMEVFGTSDKGYHSLLRNTVKFTYGEITIARTGVSRLGPTYDPNIIDSPNFDERQFTKLLKFVDSIRLPDNYSTFTVALHYGAVQRDYTGAEIFRLLEENPRIDFHIQLSCNIWHRGAEICTLNKKISLASIAEYNREDFEELAEMTDNVLCLPLPRINTKYELARLRPIEDIRYERYEKEREKRMALEQYRDPPEWTHIEHGDL